MNLPPGPLRAKSQRNGGLTLLAHTQQVMEAAVCLAEAWEMDPVLARDGAALHDLGKAHPKFQAQLWEADGHPVRLSTLERMQWNFIHRHELSSLLFLPVFSRASWDPLIEMTAGHHKSVRDDETQRGLMDLVQASGWDRVFANHARGWEAWAPQALDLLRELGYEPPEVLPEADAREAWSYVADYCERRMDERDWSPWRGLLMAADHLASAMQDRTGSALRRSFRIPSVSAFEPDQPGGLLYPLSDLPAADARPHTLLVAPTGAGKTHFLMRRGAGRRIFYTLPFQASINAMYQRFRQLLPDTDIRLRHATSRLMLRQLNPDTFEEEYPLQDMPGASVKVLTPHQLAAAVFGLPGYESLMLDLRGTAVMLDEIHTYSDVSRSMVLEIVRTLLRLDCTVHIGTATMPTVLYQQLLALLGGPACAYEVKLPEHLLDSYNRHRVFKHADWEALPAIMAEAMAAREKVLIVCNTVRDAQARYAELLEQFGRYDNMLIHSRFRRKDRAQKEMLLREKFEGQNGQPGARPCWVVATQVVEVSLDISFDRMITACAPIDALIQRFGRIHRRRWPDTLGQLKPVHIIAPAGNQKPYDGDCVRRTFGVLPADGGVLEERQLQGMLDAVYPELPRTVSIETHLICRDGSWYLPPLCNRASSVLLDTLQIDTAACILASDRAAYEAAGWDERADYEIPVSGRLLRQFQDEHPRLDIGSEPMVIPQAEKEHVRLGLLIRESDPFD